MEKAIVFRENYFIQFVLLFTEYMLYFLFLIAEQQDLFPDSHYLGSGFMFLSVYILYGIVVPTRFGGRTPFMLALGIHIVDRKNRMPNHIVRVLRGILYPFVAGFGVYVVFFAGLLVKDWPFDVLFGTRMVRINKDGRFVYARRTFEAEL